MSRVPTRTIETLTVCKAAHFERYGVVLFFLYVRAFEPLYNEVWQVFGFLPHRRPRDKTTRRKLMDDRTVRHVTSQFVRRSHVAAAGDERGTLSYLAAFDCPQ